MPNPKPDHRDIWTVMDAVQWTTSYLKKKGIDHPRIDAEILLAHVLSCARLDLYLRHDQPLNAEELASYRKLIQRRAAREPLAYILGRKEFWSMDLMVTPDVLIPRPETESLVETVLKYLTAFQGTMPPKVLELGTGTGAITLALAKEFSEGHFYATDIGFAPVRIAQENAHRQGLGHLIRFAVGNWLSFFNPIGIQFDIIISNPPYIKTADIDDLAPEIRNHEPRTALDGGPDGLRHLEAIICSVARFLVPGGWLFLEMGSDQCAGVKNIAETAGCYDYFRFERDYGGFDRIAILHKSTTGSVTPAKI